MDLCATHEVVSRVRTEKLMATDHEGDAAAVRVHNPAEHPRNSPFHDILLIRKEFIPGQRPSRLERFPVDKTTGAYRNDPAAAKAAVRPEGEGYRPTLNLGSTGGGTSAEPSRGPALSTLPLHPSPAASSATSCYLVNPQNLRYDNAWISEEFSDPPGGYNVEGRVGEDSFSLLVATPAGKVYYIEKKEGVTDKKGLAFHEVRLGFETEIWAQLRNGCVVGRVIYENAPGRKSRKDKVVPLVNIDSLNPVDAEGEKQP
jgi:hypothetical protein